MMSLVHLYFLLINLDLFMPSQVIFIYFDIFYYLFHLFYGVNLDWLTLKFHLFP